MAFIELKNNYTINLYYQQFTNVEASLEEESGKFACILSPKSQTELEQSGHFSEKMNSNQVILICKWLNKGKKDGSKYYVVGGYNKTMQILAYVSNLFKFFRVSVQLELHETSSDEEL